MDWLNLVHCFTLVWLYTNEKKDILSDPVCTLLVTVLHRMQDSISHIPARTIR